MAWRVDSPTADVWDGSRNISLPPLLPDTHKIQQWHLRNSHSMWVPFIWGVLIKRWEMFLGLSDSEYCSSYQNGNFYSQMCLKIAASILPFSFHGICEQIKSNLFHG